MSDEVPHFVDEIVVGRAGSSKNRIVTTFRNKNREIIERIYDYPHKPMKNVVYTRNDYVIAEEEFVKSTTKKEYSIQRSNIKFYNEFEQLLSKIRNKTYFWTHHKTETNHLSENIYTGEKILSRTSVVNVENINKQVHRLIEFPHVVAGKIKKPVRKLLYFEVDGTTGNIKKDSIFFDKMKFSKRDKFLQFRALDIEDMKASITRKFMKDRKVDKLDVVIDTKFIPHNDEEKAKLIACFDPLTGSVNFNILNKFPSKNFLVKVARHEVEHIWHYFLDARNGGNIVDTWQDKMFKEFGAIKNKRLKVEADKCSHAIKNYVEFTEDYAKYLKNYIEAEARTAGKVASDNYDKQGEMLRKSLPHIPKELL